MSDEMNTRWYRDEMVKAVRGLGSGLVIVAASIVVHACATLAGGR